MQSQCIGKRALSMLMLLLVCVLPASGDARAIKGQWGDVFKWPNVGIHVHDIKANSLGVRMVNLAGLLVPTSQDVIRAVTQRGKSPFLLPAVHAAADLFVYCYCHQQLGELVPRPRFDFERKAQGQLVE